MGSCCITQGAQHSTIWQPGGVGWERGVGGKFKRKGIYAYLLLIHVVVWQKPMQHCKAIILQLKKKLKRMPIHLYLTIRCTKKKVSYWNIVTTLIITAIDEHKWVLINEFIVYSWQNSMQVWKRIDWFVYTRGHETNSPQNKSGSPFNFLK